MNQFTLNEVLIRIISSAQPVMNAYEDHVLKIDMPYWIYYCKPGQGNNVSSPF